MVDLNKILTNFSQSGALTGLAGGLAGGVAGSALMSKKGRKTAAKLIKLGGVAAVGGLAWNAYRNYPERQAPGSAGRNWRGFRDWMSTRRQRSSRWSSGWRRRSGRAKSRSVPRRVDITTLASPRWCVARAISIRLINRTNSLTLSN